MSSKWNQGHQLAARGMEDVVAAILQDLIHRTMGKELLSGIVYLCFVLSSGQRFWCGRGTIFTIVDEWGIESLAEY